MRGRTATPQPTAWTFSKQKPETRGRASMAAKRLVVMNEEDILEYIEERKTVWVARDKK